MFPDRYFPRYTRFDPAAPVWCLTPGDSGQRCIHRFYDTSPISPSGRYLAVTRLPYEDRLPRPGDVAQVVIVDMHSGDCRIVAETAGWDAQVGAHVQWGVDDEQLLFNDLDVATWRPFGVRLNPATGDRVRLDHAIYTVASDGRWAVSPCVRRTARTQAGYGVVAPPEVVPANVGAAADDGVWRIDTQTGTSRLIVSLADLHKQLGDRLGFEPLERGPLYGFHVKPNGPGDRVMFVVRQRLDRGGLRPALVTFQADGTDPHVAVRADQWERGGHHPNWCPDGEHIVMNLRLNPDEPLRFVCVRYDGSDLHPIAGGAVGSGHPTLSPCAPDAGARVLTDAYPHEPVAFGDGTVPLRWVGAVDGRERTLVRIGVVPPYTGPANAMRVDPHPAWDRSGRFVVFNACPQGTRRVYLVDMTTLTKH